jgi:transcriptional regulator with XRE-family HTH domain
MVKQNLIIMKQPQLGQRIQEWRKAKGLTQEELVERCNINVRTIQRIEAGEVTPRSYTVKAILEALEVNADEIPEPRELDALGNEKLKSWLKYSFLSGIIYLLLAVIESILDVSLLMEKESFSLGWGTFYTVIKISVMILFIFFMGGFFKLGQHLSNLLMSSMAVVLSIVVGLIVLEDVFTYWLRMDLLSGLIMRSIVAGVLYALFSVCFLYLSKKKGTLYLLTGASGLLTAICFLTVVLAIPALIFLTIFEILSIVLLHQEYKQKSTEDLSPFSSSAGAFS